MTIKTNRMSAFVLILGLYLCFSCQVMSQPQNLFRIGTGGKTGVYYPIGKLIAQGLTDYSRQSASQTVEQQTAGVIGVAQISAGSLGNLETTASGETEAGLVQADVASWAYQSIGPFSGKTNYQGIRAIASLYPEKFQIVARKDAGITRFSDLKEKSVSLDEQGSGTLAVMRILLKAHQLSESDLNAVYLKPVFTREKMISGELQGFVMMAGAPMEAVLSLNTIGISLVPIQRNIAEAIHREYPYLVPGTIEAEVYPGMPETPTIQVYALLVVDASTDNDLIYRFTSILWSSHTLSLLRQGHPQGKAISLETALSGLSIPLHDGAKRFYREQGMLTQENN